MWPQQQAWEKELCHDMRLRENLNSEGHASHAQEAVLTIILPDWDYKSTTERYVMYLTRLQDTNICQSKNGIYFQSNIQQNCASSSSMTECHENTNIREWENSIKGYSSIKRLLTDWTFTFDTIGHKLKDACQSFKSITNLNQTIKKRGRLTVLTGGLELGHDQAKH